MKDIQEQIKDITDFTCSYWWPAYELAEKNKETIPTYKNWGDVVVNSIIAKLWRPLYGGNDVFLAHKIDTNTENIVISTDYFQHGISIEFLDSDEL